MRLFTKFSVILFLVSTSVLANKTSTSTATTTRVMCIDNASCDNHGVCDIETGKCRCNSGYTEEFCTYEQYKQVYAFLLHFFLGLPFDVGYFYVGDYVVVGLKSALFFASTILACSFEGCMCNQGPNSLIGRFLGATPCALGGVCGLFGLALVFGWWLADNILFGTNQIRDHDGQVLESW